ncbi:MAG: hypothetical protein ABH874_00595 [Methanobacteriota archaeon]
MTKLREIWREYGGSMLIGGLWGLATLESFFLNIWLNFEPGLLIKIITLPGYIAHKIPFYKLPILPDTLGGILSILIPVITGVIIGALIHKINKEVFK